MHVTSVFYDLHPSYRIQSFDMNYVTLKRVYEKNTRPTSSRKHLTQFFAGTGGGPWFLEQLDFFQNAPRFHSSSRIEPVMLLGVAAI